MAGVLRLSVLASVHCWGQLVGSHGSVGSCGRERGRFVVHVGRVCHDRARLALHTASHSAGIELHTAPGNRSVRTASQLTHDKRLPAFLFFALLLCFALFCAVACSCTRTRTARVYRRVVDLCRRHVCCVCVVRCLCFTRSRPPATTTCWPQTSSANAAQASLHRPSHVRAHPVTSLCWMRRPSSLEPPRSLVASTMTTTTTTTTVVPPKRRRHHAPPRRPQPVGKKKKCIPAMRAMLSVIMRVGLRTRSLPTKKSLTHSGCALGHGWNNAKASCAGAALLA